MSAKYDSATKTKPGNSSELASKRPRKDLTDIADKVGAIQCLVTSLMHYLFPATG
jgi:hypothetical protein